MRVAIGEILAAQGIQGEVKVKALTDYLDRFDDLVRVFIDEAEYTLKSYRVHKGEILVISFAEITDRTAAEALRGKLITIPIEEVADLPQDTYYHFELEGLEVVSTTGEVIGKLVEVIPLPANDVFRVETYQPRSEPLLIPALRHVVLEVDLDGKKMTVDLPEGL